MFGIYEKLAVIFKQAEVKRLELILSNKFDPKFSEKFHPRAIFTSRALSSLISKSSTKSSSSMISFNLVVFL